MQNVRAVEETLKKDFLRQVPDLILSSNADDIHHAAVCYRGSIYLFISELLELLNYRKLQDF